METLPRYLCSTIEALPDNFQPEDFLLEGRRRTRIFTPRLLILTLIQLVSFANKEGYDHALTKLFGFLHAPVKSALAQFRKKISFLFFKRIFDRAIKHFDKHRPTFNGLILYAADGWQFTLPRTNDVVNAGYTGRATSKYKESYMPKAFLTHIYDVLSETTKAFVLNNSQTELADALALIEHLEANSLTLYDRAYFSKALAVAHLEAGNYFIARCQSNANKKVADFFKNEERNDDSMYYQTKTKGKKKIWFIKVINSKTKEPVVFATNLPRHLRKPKLFEQLYQLRWGAETSFYELSETLKMQQWHSKSMNGVLQELYTAFLSINLTKIVSFFAKGQRHINPEIETYQKPNFKLLHHHFVDFITTTKPKLSNLIHRFQVLIKRSTERRRRRSRCHPRELRSPASPYPRNNTEWKWDKAYSLN